MKRLLAISALLFASFAFAAPNLTGKWTIHNSIAGNENDQECKFVVTDNKITGSCKSQDKDLLVTGTVDGNKVSWQYQSEYNGTPLTLIYTANLDGSGKIAGTVEVQPYGVTGDFAAAKSSASSQSGRAAAGQSSPEEAATEQLLVVQAGPGGSFINNKGGVREDTPLAVRVGARNGGADIRTA